MAFSLSEPPGITEIPSALLAAGAAASGFVMSALKDSAAFGSVVPEFFYGTYGHGQTVALPISSVDGYQYERVELIYIWDTVNTVSNTSGLPSGGGGGLNYFEQYVEQSTGYVHSTEMYVVGENPGVVTHDGVLGVWTVGVRARQLRVLASQPVYTDIPYTDFAEDNATTTTPLLQLAENTKLASVQCEVFMVNPSGAPPWQPNTAYAAGNLIQPTTLWANGYWYIAASSGTSGPIEPVWPSAFRDAAPIIDGSITWNVAGAGFINGQQIDYPASGVDGYQYSSADVVIPFVSFITTQGMPIQYHEGVILTSSLYDAAVFQKSVTSLQPALPTSTQRGNANNVNYPSYTVLPESLQIGTGTYIPPPSMTYAPSLNPPGSTTTGVGIVNCGVIYVDQDGSAVHSSVDGTCMVWLICFRQIAAMAEVPGSSVSNLVPGGSTFIDIPTQAFTSGNALRSDYMGDDASNVDGAGIAAGISGNARFSILRPEVFSMQYDATASPTNQNFITSPQIVPGGQVPLPVSPVDGYIYGRSELTYLWWFTNSTGPNPTRLLQFSLYIDPQTGIINTRVELMHSNNSGGVNQNVGIVVYGDGGLLESQNMGTTGRGILTLNVIVIAQRKHETELQAQIIVNSGGGAASTATGQNLIPNGGFEIWPMANPNSVQLSGAADDWFVNLAAGSGTQSDAGVNFAFQQFPGTTGQLALMGMFSQSVGAAPSANNLTDRRATPPPNGNNLASIVSEIVPIWPGGKYSFSFLASAYAATNIYDGFSPDVIRYGFYARVHLIGANTSGTGTPDMSTDCFFDLLGSDGGIGVAEGTTVGANAGGSINVSPPSSTPFDFSFTVPNTTGATTVQTSAGTAVLQNGVAPDVTSYTLPILPGFAYIEFLLWDIVSGTNIQGIHLRFAVLDNVSLSYSGPTYANNVILPSGGTLHFMQPFQGGNGLVNPQYLMPGGTAQFLPADFGDFTLGAGWTLVANPIGSTPAAVAIQSGTTANSQLLTNPAVFPIDVQAGYTYILQSSLFPQSGAAGSAHCFINWYNASGGLISTSVGSTVVPGGPNESFLASTTPPSGATSLAIGVEVDPPSGGNSGSWIAVNLYGVGVSSNLDGVPDGNIYIRPLGVNSNHYQGSIGVVQLIASGSNTATTDLLSQSGTTAAIDIAAFSVQYGFGIVNYNSGTVNPGAYGTWNVYYYDPTYAGGAPAYGITDQYSLQYSEDGNQGLGVITTTSSGGATGGGGGGGTKQPCFAPWTLIRTPNGNVRIDDLRPGDMVFTAKGVWRPVFAVTSGDYKGPLHNIPETGAATPGHRILCNDKWISIAETGMAPDTFIYTGRVFNVLVQSEEPEEDGMKSTTEHSYQLANGWFAHNFLPVC